MSIKTNAEQIRDETTTGANTALRVGTNLVEIADDLVTKGTAIDLNTAKTTNATHTGDVTGATVLAIGAKKVTLAMMADGVDGELITYDATGVAAKVAVGTATHVLTSNGIGLAPTFQAAGGGGGATLTAYKTADETKVSDTTLAIDVDVQVELEANSTYTFLFNLLQTGDPSGDLKIQFSGSGADFSWIDLFYNNSVTPNTLATIETVACGGLTSLRTGHWIGNVITTTACTFGMEWSQSVSTAFGSTIKQGTWIELIKLN